MRRALVLALLLAPALASAAVTGRVMDADGKPLAGIRVRVFARETPGAMYGRFLSETPERTAVGSAQTKADGTFSVDVKSHGVVDLILDGDNREPVVAEVVDGEDAGAFALRAGRKVRGRITARGKGVANATVVIAGDIVVRTREDGSYEVVPPALMSRGSLVAVTHPDYAPVMTGNTLDRKTPYDVELRPGIAVSGRVLASDGKTPVAGAIVRAYHWPLAKSGDDGTYRIAHAPVLEALFAIEGSRVGRVTFDKRQASHDIVLRAGSSISGTVRSSKDDAPIPGARVTIASPGMSTQPTAITDAKGNYTLAPIAPTAGNLYVQHPTFAGDWSSIDVAEGVRVTQNLSVTPLARIRGSVVDEQRRPVAAARASLTMSGAVAATGPDGTFTLRAQRTSQPMSVVVARSGYATASAGPFALQPGELKSVQISLRRGFRFEIQLVDREGKPIPNEPLMVQRWTDPDDAQSRTAMVCSETEPTLCYHTDESGRRAFELLDGKYDVMAGGRTTQTKTVAQQMLDARSKPLVIELDRGSVVEGRVLGADDQPVEGATVSTANRASVAQSDAMGAFAFRNLAPGVPVTLTAEIRGGLYSEPVSVTSPASDVIVRLPRPARIEGRVFDRESKQPVRDFSITLVRERRQYGMAPPKKFTTDDGRFVLDEISPGKLDLNVQAKGYAPGSFVDVAAAAGATATVEIALDRGSTVTGRVTSGGTPVSDASISLAMGSSRGGIPGMPPQVRTDTGGEFTIDGVPPGTQNLSIRKNGYVSKMTTVDVSAGRENRADVELERGRTLEGRVVDSAGRGLSLADVTFRNAPMPMIRTDADGAFRAEGLGDQTYTVMARKDGYLNAEVELNPAQNASVTITLGRGGSISGRVVGVAEADLQSVDVSASGERGWRSTAKPDATGNFTIQGVPDGRADIRAMQMRPTRRQSEPKIIEVVNGSGPFVQLDFNAGIAVRGRVTRNGKTVEGAVTFSPADPAQRGLTNTWAELVAGAYEVRLAEPGEYMVRVQQMYGQRMTGAPQKLTVTSAMTHDIEIRGATLRGRVVDERTGAPIAGAMVEVSSPGWGTNAASDSDGRFSLDSLIDATYRVTAARDRYVGEPTEVVVSGGDAEVEVRLRQGEPIGVRVVDAANGRPLDASITPRQKSGVSSPSSRPARVGNGVQRLWLLPGTYTVDVWVEGYIRRMVDLQVPGPDIHVMLERGGTVIVQGRVSGAAFVRLRAGEKKIAMSSVSGRMESVPAGTYTLEALDEKQNVLATREGVAVISGQTTTVTW